MKKPTRGVHIGPVKVKMEGNVCPHCGRTAEGATALDIDQKPPDAPKPGDFAVCLYCARVNAYNDDLKLRRLNPIEALLLKQDPRLRRVLEIAEMAAKAKRGEWQ